MATSIGITDGSTLERSETNIELFTNASEERRSFRICAKVFDQVNGHGTGKMTI